MCITFGEVFLLAPLIGNNHLSIKSSLSLNILQLLYIVKEQLLKSTSRQQKIKHMLYSSIESNSTKYLNAKSNRVRIFQKLNSTKYLACYM